LQALSNKKRNYNYSQGIEINRKSNEEFKNNYINIQFIKKDFSKLKINISNNMNVLLNNNSLSENDKRSGYQIKEIKDILFDSKRNKVIIKVK